MVDSPAGRFTVTGESTTFQTNTYNYNRFVSSFVYIHFLKLDLKLSATKKDWFEFIILNEMSIYIWSIRRNLPLVDSPVSVKRPDDESTKNLSH